MGCVLSTSPRPPQLDKSKAERGYVGRGNGGRPNVQKYPSRNPSKLPRREANGKNHVDGAERKGMSRERDSNSTSTSAPRRVSKKKIVADDLVDGWPKWLVDHIPRDTSAGLVPKSADSYEKLSKLGQGTYSNVYKARDRDTGKIVALKKVRFDTSEPESVKFMAREIIILQRLDHPNIIKLEGLATSRMPYSLYLVFDFMQSDLARVISQPEGRLTEPQVKCYMQQLLSGLQHCHERGILHRDIKGSNLLIDKNGVLKIADFGLANFFQPKPKKPLTSRVVTLWYRAPELLLGSTDYGVGIDLWSTGCLLAEMFIGRPIMPGRTEVEQLHKIFKLCGSPSEDYWRRRKLSTTFRPPQEYKPNFQEAFANLPMSSFSLLTTLLALEPAYRGTATSALQNEFFSSSPLACDLSGLPSIYEEDEPIMTNDPKKMRAHRKTQQPQKYSGGHKKKVSITEPAKEDSGSFIEERYSQELSSSFSSISLHRKSTGTDQESPPSSPTQAFRAYGNQYTRTQAHPNAMKNIKNFPILYASMGNPISFEDNRLTSSSFEDNRLTLNQRSISTVDLRTADLEKISKLFGLEDN